MVTLLKIIAVKLYVLEARFILYRYKPKIIVVSGTIGKSMTSDVLYALMAEKAHVRLAERDGGTDLSVTHAILGLRVPAKNPLTWVRNLIEGCARCVQSNKYPTWIIVEVNPDNPKTIDALLSWLKFDICIFTVLPESSSLVEKFESKGAVLRNIRQLSQGLRESGVVIYNSDDPRSDNLKMELRGHMISYSLDNIADFSALQYANEYSEGSVSGVSFRLAHGGSSIPLSLKNVLGKRAVSSVMAAITGAHTAGLDLVSIGDSVSRLHLPRSRMSVLTGINNSVVIDDSYTATPFDTIEAIKTIDDVEITGRKIIVLGDMLQLGKYSVDEHKKVGVIAASVADVIITVGIRAKDIARAALESGARPQLVMQYESDEAAKAGQELEHEIQAGDVILVKGSEKVALKKTVAKLVP